MHDADDLDRAAAELYAEHAAKQGEAERWATDRLHSVAQDLVDRQIDVAWGGGGYLGPSFGLRDEGFADSHGDFDKVGFDAGSLAQYVVFQVWDFKIPRTPSVQFSQGVPVGMSDLQPGDLVFPGSCHGEYGMVYLGDGAVVEARQSGEKIRISALPEADLQIRRFVKTIAW